MIGFALLLPALVAQAQPRTVRLPDSRCGGNATHCAALFADLPRKVPVDVHIGNGDPNYAWAMQDWQRMLNNGWSAGDTLSFNAFAGGHTFTLPQLSQVAEFACGFAVQP